jgi:hypothetical protein
MSKYQVLAIRGSRYSHRVGQVPFRPCLAQVSSSCHVRDNCGLARRLDHQIALSRKGPGEFMYGRNHKISILSGCTRIY